MKTKALFAVLAAIALAGCGDNYRNAFRDWLGLQVAKSSPARLASLETQTVQKTDYEAIFNFSGTFEVTQDLYSAAEAPGTAELAGILARARSAGVQEVIESDLPALRSAMSIPYLVKATAKGARQEVTGKASYRKTDAGPSFAILDISGEQLAGTPPPNSRWVAAGSPEDAKHKEEIAALIGGLDAKVAGLIAQKEAEDAARAAEVARLKAEEEARLKARHDEFLAAFKPGTSVAGTWETNDARGNIGIAFTAQNVSADEISVGGFLFDPSNPDYRKPFFGSASGTGEEGSPFLLKLRVTAMDGGIRVQNPKQARNQTAGLLLAQCNYPFTLAYEPGQSGFVGKIAATGGDTFYVTDYPYPRFSFRGMSAPAAAPALDVSGQSVSGQQGAGLSAGVNYGGGSAQADGATLEENNILLQLTAGAGDAITKAIQRGDIDTAVRLHRELQKNYPESPVTIAANMVMASRAGDREDVDRQFQRLMAMNISPSLKAGFDRVHKMMIENLNSR